MGASVGHHSHGEDGNTPGLSPFIKSIFRFLGHYFLRWTFFKTAIWVLQVAVGLNPLLETISVSFLRGVAVILTDNKDLKSCLILEL